MRSIGTLDGVGVILLLLPPPALLLATEEYVVLAGARSSSPGRLEVDACAHVARPCAAWASWRSAAAVFWSPNFAAPRLTALSRASLRAGPAKSIVCHKRAQIPAGTSFTGRIMERSRAHHGVRQVAQQAAQGSRGPSRGGGPSGIKYAGAGSFRDNGISACALVPALVVALGFAHELATAVLILGTTATTILDLIGAKEATFFGVWATLVVAFAGSCFAVLAGADQRSRETALTLEALFTIIAEAQLFALVGFWATIQFKWVQAQHPGATLALEKLVMTTAPLASLVVVSHGLIAAVGSGQAPFYAMAWSILLHNVFYGSPKQSSFVKGRGGRGRNETNAVERSDAMVCTAALLSLPWVLYLVLHSPEVWPFAPLAISATHCWSLLLLFGAPLMYLSVCPQRLGQRKGGPGLLWWLDLSVDGTVAARVVLANLSLVAMVLGLEGRVVFRSFSQYIRLEAPWNYIAVTLALSGGGAAVVNFLIVADAESLKEKFESAVTLGRGSMADGSAGLPTWIGMVFILSIAAGCLALGMTTLALVSALTCAAGLVLFMESRVFRDYVIFVAGLAGVMVWFLGENFWHLDVTTGALHVREICVMATMACALSALIPGLAVTSFGGRRALATVMLAQACLLVYLERGMTFGARDSRIDQGDLAYPPYLVLITSALGCAGAERLKRARKISNFSSWILKCILGSKVSMLILEESHLVVPCAVFAMAATAPVALYRAEDGPASGDAGASAMGTEGLGLGIPMVSPHRGERRASRVHMVEWQGWCHAGLILGAVIYARFAVFDILREILGARPNEGLLVGSLIMVASAACIPLVTRHFPYTKTGRRVLVSCLASGLVIALVRPPMSITGGARCPRLPFELCPRLWDADHRPSHEVDDVSIYGDLVKRREHWPKWLLVVSVVSGLATLGIGGGRRGSRRQPTGGAMGSALPRLVLALVSGCGIGAYMSLELFPDYKLMQFVVGGTTAVCILVLALVFGSPGAGGGALTVFWALVCGLPATLGLCFLFPPQRPYSDDVRLYVDVERDLEADARVSVLMAHMVYMLVIAFSIKLKITQGGATSMGGRGDPRKGPAGPMATAALIGNVATCETFVLCLSLFSQTAAFSADAYVVFMLCPILLLLNQDGVLLKKLREGRRYAPVVAAIPLVLTTKAMGDAFAQREAAQGGGGPSWVGAILNLAAILVTLPNQISFAKFLWLLEQTSESQVVLVVGTPLNLVAMLICSGAAAQAVRLQALAGIVIACVQWYAGGRIQRRGMEIL